MPESSELVTASVTIVARSSTLIEIGESLLPRMTPEELAVTVSVKVPMKPWPLSPSGAPWLDSPVPDSEESPLSSDSIVMSYWVL